MRSEHQKCVDRFMLLAQQNAPAVPTMPDEKTRVLRARLILEEALETAAALGVSVTGSGGGAPIEGTDDLLLTADKEPNLVEIVDGCCDVLVVTTGTLSAIGVDDEEVLAIVDQNNLDKFGPGGYRDAGGKWIKPPGHKPPTDAIAAELARQGQRE